MISTDGVKNASGDINILDPQSIVDELNKLQSQKFVDPNCDPAEQSIIDISKVDKCDNPLEGRLERLTEFLKKLPTLPSGDNKAACSQAALTKLETIIKTKYSTANIEENTKKNLFEEEKVESQLLIVTYMSLFVDVLYQVNRKVPLLFNNVRSKLIETINIINAVKTNDKISEFEKQNLILRLSGVLARMNANVPDNRTHSIYNHAGYDFVLLQNTILSTTTSDTMKIVLYNTVFLGLNKNIRYNQRQQSVDFNNDYRIAGELLLASQTRSLDIYYNEVIRRKGLRMNNTYEFFYSQHSNFPTRARILAYFHRLKPDMDVVGFTKTINNLVIRAFDDLTNFFNAYINEIPKTPSEADVINEIKGLDFCGAKLPVAEDTPDDTPNTADLTHNNFDIANKPTITDIAYWKKYSIYLNLVNLLPPFWTIGLYIPTPGGILKVPLPTVWKPLVVINANPFGLIVIFLTINGIVISPTVWIYKFKPFGENESNLAIMIRAFNKKIKDNTGNRIAGISIFNNIDINPEITKRLPVTQDDLPTIRRLGLNNLAYVNYLREWLTQYKSGGGLP